MYIIILKSDSNIFYFILFHVLYITIYPFILQMLILSRFWIALRFQQLHSFRKFGRSVSVEELVVDSKLIGWAYHSDCQENLFGSFLPNESSWQEMRNLGVGFWFTNTAQLRSRVIIPFVFYIITSWTKQGNVSS